MSVSYLLYKNDGTVVTKGAAFRVKEAEKEAKKRGLNLLLDFDQLVDPFEYRVTNEKTLEKKPEDQTKLQEEALVRMRKRRNAMLRASDWTQLPDVRLSSKEVSAWRDYRDALRDLPDTITDPYNIVWPELPEVKSKGKK